LTSPFYFRIYQKKLDLG